MTLHTDPIYERSLNSGPYTQTKQRNPVKMELSENVTLPTGSYQGERGIRVKNVMHTEKNISFKRPEWTFLMGLLDKINTFLLSLDKSKNAEKTCDLLRDPGGKKRVTAKKNWKRGRNRKLMNFQISRFARNTGITQDPEGLLICRVFQNDFNVFEHCLHILELCFDPLWFL